MSDFVPFVLHPTRRNPAAKIAMKKLQLDGVEG